MVYLDDFLCIGSSVKECKAAQLVLIELLIQVSPSTKTEVVNPTTRVQFLGYIIDSVLERVELPQDKLQSLSRLSIDYVARSELTKREVQSIFLFPFYQDAPC